MELSDGGVLMVIKSQPLDRKQLLAAPAGDYMNEAQLAFFKEMLQTLKQQTMAHVEEVKQRLGSPPDISDEIDRAQYEEESRLLIRMLDRERKLLPKIDQALRRIARGEFGYCLESGEPIGLPRLLIRPVSEYCTDVKMLNEGAEKHYQED